jgi:hypothetical protein
MWCEFGLLLLLLLLLFGTLFGMMFYDRDIVLREKECLWQGRLSEIVLGKFGLMVKFFIDVFESEKK